jgi:hypothetical protein
VEYYNKYTILEITGKVYIYFRKLRKSKIFIMVGPGAGIHLLTMVMKK